MVTKKTIGKVQLAVGIIMILITLVGVFCILNLFDLTGYSPEGFAEEVFSLHDYYNDAGKFNTSIGRLSYDTLVGQISNIYRQESFFNINLLLNLSLFSAICFFISLLFITQGLINISGENR